MAFLTVVSSSDFGSYEFPSWVGLVQVCILAFVVAVPTCWWLVATQLHAWEAESITLYFVRASVHCTVLGFVSCATMLPIFVVAAKYLECGEALVKFTTVAYMDSSPTLEYITAVLVCVYGAASAYVLSSFIPKPHNEQRTSSFALQRAAFLGHSRATLPTTDIDRINEAVPEGNLKVLPNHRHSRFRDHMVALGWFALWLLALGTLSIPSILYVMRYVSRTWL